MYRFVQIVKQDFMNLVKNPMWVYYCTLFPFLLIFIMGFLFSGSYGKEVSSYDYYGITMMLFSTLYTAALSSNSFMEERIKMSNMRIIYSPVNTSYIYLSKILATFLFSFLCHVLVILILSSIFHVNYGKESLLSIIILYLMAELFASTLGVMLCCIFKSENTANQILSIIVNIFGILGGVFFQLDGLGKSIVKLSNISPVKWVLKAAFQIIYDNDYSYFLPTISVLFVATFCLICICKLTFRTEDYV